MRRLLLLFAFALVGPATAKDPPAGRPAFDLSLFTRSPDGGVMLLRPAEIAAHSGVPEEGVAAFVGQTTQALAGFVDPGLKAEDLPPLSTIEQAAFGLSIGLKLSTDQEEGSFSITGTNFGFVRTADKFDWAGLVTKAFPKAVPKTHAGAEYLSVGVKFGGWEWAAGFYVADERTLVFDVDADKLEGWLAGRGKKQVPDMPAGWTDVRGCSAAFVMPAGDRSWMTTPAGELNGLSPLMKEFVNGLTSACVGVTFGEITSVVGVFTATSEDNASAVEGVVNKGLTGIEEGLAGLLAGKAKATTTRTGDTVRTEATVKANVLKGFVRTLGDENK